MAETWGERDFWESAVNFLELSVDILGLTQVDLRRRERSFWGEHHFAVFAQVIPMAVEKAIL